ncbi:MAG: hypothetical protein KF832_07505 [Caldilineaceae bacterium]|nr:hypothetical protein [Caldilineaceae bacterium]
MTDTAPTTTQPHSSYRSFILRVTWDAALTHWCIQLQPVNGEAIRLFCDSESLVLYLEAIMHELPTKPSMRGKEVSNDE